MSARQTIEEKIRAVETEIDTHEAQIRTLQLMLKTLLELRDSLPPDKRRRENKVSEANE